MYHAFPSHSPGLIGRLVIARPSDADSYTLTEETCRVSALRPWGSFSVVVGWEIGGECEI